MSIENIIGSSYCCIGFIHLVIYIVKSAKIPYSERDPMDAFVAALCWPLLDVLLIIPDRKSGRNADDDDKRPS